MSGRGHGTIENFIPDNFKLPYDEPAIIKIENSELVAKTEPKSEDFKVSESSMTNRKAVKAPRQTRACSLCTKAVSYDSQTEWYAHFVHEHYHAKLLELNKGNMRQCTLCNTDMGEEKCLKHVGIAHRLIETLVSEQDIYQQKEKTDKKGRKVNFVPCYLCLGDIHVTEKTTYYSHIIQHFRQQLLEANALNASVCSVCQKEFPCVQHLLRHVAISHDKLEELIPKEFYYMSIKPVVITSISKSEGNSSKEIKCKKEVWEVSKHENKAEDEKPISNENITTEQHKSKSARKSSLSSSKTKRVKIETFTDRGITFMQDSFSNVSGDSADSDDEEDASFLPKARKNTYSGSRVSKKDGTGRNIDEVRWVDLKCFHCNKYIDPEKIAEDKVQSFKHKILYRHYIKHFRAELLEKFTQDKKCCICKEEFKKSHLTDHVGFAHSGSLLETLLPREAHWSVILEKMKNSSSSHDQEMNFETPHEELMSIKVSDIETTELDKNSIDKVLVIDSQETPAEEVTFKVDLSEPDSERQRVDDVKPENYGKITSIPTKDDGSLIDSYLSTLKCFHCKEYVYSEYILGEKKIKYKHKFLYRHYIKHFRSELFEQFTQDQKCCICDNKFKKRSSLIDHVGFAHNCSLLEKLLPREAHWSVILEKIKKSVSFHDKETKCEFPEELASMKVSNIEDMPKAEENLNDSKSMGSYCESLLSEHAKPDSKSIDHCSSVPSSLNSSCDMACKTLTELTSDFEGQSADSPPVDDKNRKPCSEAKTINNCENQDSKSKSNYSSEDLENLLITADFAGNNKNRKPRSVAKPTSYCDDLDSHIKSDENERTKNPLKDLESTSSPKIDNVKFSTPKRNSVNIIVSASKRIMECFDCKEPISYLYKSDLYRHYIQHLTKELEALNPNPKKCTFCGRDLQRANFHMHIALVHNKLEELIPDHAKFRKPVQIPITKRAVVVPKVNHKERIDHCAKVTCEFCSKVIAYQSRQVLYRHYSTHFKDNLLSMNTSQGECDFCELQVSPEIEMVRHIGAVHEKVEIFLPDHLKLSDTGKKQSNVKDLPEVGAGRRRTRLSRRLSNSSERNGASSEKIVNSTPKRDLAKSSRDKPTSKCSKTSNLYRCFSCPFKKTIYKSARHIMYGHYAKHFNGKLIKYMSGNSCNICDYSVPDSGASSKQNLRKHVAIVHDVLDKLLPEHAKINRAGKKAHVKSELDSDVVVLLDKKMTEKILEVVQVDDGHDNESASSDNETDDSENEEQQPQIQFGNITLETVVRKKTNGRIRRSSCSDSDFLTSSDEAEDDGIEIINEVPGIVALNGPPQDDFNQRDTGSKGSIRKKKARKLNKKVKEKRNLKKQVPNSTIRMRWKNRFLNIRKPHYIIFKQKTILAMIKSTWPKVNLSILEKKSIDGPDINDRDDIYKLSASQDSRSKSVEINKENVLKDESSLIYSSPIVMTAIASEISNKKVSESSLVPLEQASINFANFLETMAVQSCSRKYRSQSLDTSIEDREYSLKRCRSAQGLLNSQMETVVSSSFELNRKCMGIADPRRKVPTPIAQSTPVHSRPSSPILSEKESLKIAETNLVNSYNDSLENIRVTAILEPVTSDESATESSKQKEEHLDHIGEDYLDQYVEAFKENNSSNGSSDTSVTVNQYHTINMQSNLNPEENDKSSILSEGIYKECKVFLTENENTDAKQETKDDIKECMIEILNNLLENIEHSQNAKKVELACYEAKENIIQTADMNKSNVNAEEVLNRSCDLVEDLSFTSVDSTSSEPAWTSAANSSGQTLEGENDVQDEILEWKSDQAKGFFKFLEEKEAKSGKRFRSSRTKRKVVPKVKRASKSCGNSNVKKGENR